MVGENWTETRGIANHHADSQGNYCTDPKHNNLSTNGIDHGVGGHQNDKSRSILSGFCVIANESALLTRLTVGEQIEKLIQFRGDNDLRPAVLLTTYGRRVVIFRAEF